MKTKSLFKKFEAAADAEERRELLGRLELGWGLPARELRFYYAVDPEVVRDFVDEQIEMFARWDDVPDTAPFRTYLRNHDPDYARELFRRTCSPQEWEERVASLSDSLSDDALVEELERIHPQVHGGFPGASVFEKILREHGDDVVPYIRAHIGERWHYAGWESFISLLEEQARWGLWDRAVSGSASQDFDTYVNHILESAEERPGWARQRLQGISGASFVSWVGRNVAKLGDEVAAKVYRRFPNLLKSALDEHINTFRLNARSAAYRRLFGELIRAGDLAYIDRLAGKMLSVSLYIWGDTNQYESVFEHLVNYFARIDDDAEYTERVSRALSAFQPDDEEHWYTLRQNNPLYEVFFEQPERFTARTEVITDLLESAFVAVRSLGFRALLATGDECGQLAADNVQLVLAAPLDRLPSPGMRAALAATRAMTDYEPSLGSVVLNRLREASSLAYPSFSKGELVRTMGHILRQSPELQRASEQTVIYDHASAEGGHW
ncbi:MAG: hypothetical protein ACQEVA_17040 [Myxococcota bacterium]